MSMDNGEGYRFGRFTLSTARASLEAHGAAIDLRPKSFDVLRYLVENAGRIATKDEIVAAVWPNVVVTDDSLTQCVRDVRKALDDDGERFIKTVPRRGYLFVADVQPLTGLEGSPSSGLRRWRLPAATGLAVTLILFVLAGWTSGLLSLQSASQDTRMTVAVLPFTNLSENPEGEWLGDGIAEDIITAVSRFRDISVIARNSSFRYRDNVDGRTVGRDLNADFLLMGTVRRGGDRLRVTAQLVDSRTGTSRWTERYDRPFADVFAIQDEIADSVAALLVSHAREATAARVRRQLPDNLEAYELVLRARKGYLSFTREGAIEARALLERAIQMDANYAAAWELLARVIIQFFIQPYDSSQGDLAVVREARAVAEKAVALDPNLSTAHGTLGWTLAFLQDYDASLEALRRGLSINPNDADSARNYATALAHAGFFRESLDAWDEAMRLDPFVPPIAYALRAKNHIMLGEHDKALPLSRTCAERAPQLLPCSISLAISANELGLVDESRAAADRIMELNPNFGIARQLRIIQSAKVEDAARFAEYLRRAGLPE